MRYSRLGRAHMPQQLTVDWRPADADAMLWIARSYLDEFAIHEIRPPPSAVVSGPDRVYYTFRFLLLIFRLSGKRSLRSVIVSAMISNSTKSNIERAILEKNGAISIVPRRRA